MEVIQTPRLVTLVQILASLADTYNLQTQSDAAVVVWVYL